VKRFNEPSTIAKETEKVEKAKESSSDQEEFMDFFG
jgi:hypothetical protein